MAVTETCLQYTTENDIKKRGIAAIIVCGGSSSRMKGVDKMFAEIGGKPVAALTIEKFCNNPFVESIVVVVKKENVLKMQQLCNKFDFKKVTDIVEGGNCRQESVACGLECVALDTEVVLIHDGARPFVSDTCIKNVIDAARKYNAATVAVGLKDTVKKVKSDGLVAGTPNRNDLVAVQTPQGFKADMYRSSVENLKDRLHEFTDDCSVVEAAGYPVYTVEGDYKNIKITTTEDLEYAEFLLMRGNL
jgi:2-C-methyl-D-erythritol 4-phosphate cytidylyltransferase